MDEELKRQIAESVRKWEARPRYSELTPEVLAAVPDDLLEQAIVDFVMAHGEWQDDALLTLFASLPEGFGIVYTSWALDAEMDLTGLDPRQQLEAFSASAQASELDPLDSRWYDLGDLAAAQVRFIREAPALFTARLPE